MKARHILSYILGSIFFIHCSFSAYGQTSKSIERHVPEDYLIELLSAGKFEALSKQLGKLQSTYIADSTTENDVHKSFYVFSRPDQKIERQLDAWISSRSTDAYAYLARGIYRTKMGWESRGGAYNANTSRPQFSGMGSWFKAAKDDLTRSIQLEPTLVHPYCYLIEIEQNEGGRKTRDLYNKALQINPDSFIAREYYLWSQLPRWGGSHAAMQDTISEMRSHYKKAPQLAALEGRIAADVAEIAASENDFQTAIKNYKLALTKGDFWFYRQKLGEVLTSVGDPKGALEQFSLVIQTKPGWTRAWQYRSRAFGALNQIPDALADIDYAIKLAPGDALLFSDRGMYRGRSGDHIAALKDFQTAARLAPAEEFYREQTKAVQAILKSSVSK